MVTINWFHFQKQALSRFMEGWFLIKKCDKQWLNFGHTSWLIHFHAWSRNWCHSIFPASMQKETVCETQTFCYKNSLQAHTSQQHTIMRINRMKSNNEMGLWIFKTFVIRAHQNHVTSDTSGRTLAFGFQNLCTVQFWPSVQPLWCMTYFNHLFITSKAVSIHDRPCQLFKAQAGELHNDWQLYTVKQHWFTMFK